MATTKGGLEAALIENLSTGEKVHFMFNPNEFSVDKSNEWETKDAKGKNVPVITFSKGGAQSLKLQLFFDSYADKSDVRSNTDMLWKMMMVDETKKHQRTDKSSPPTVAFQWGGMFYFKAVIKSMSQKFTMFLDDGTPVRTTVDITLQQVVDEDSFDPQNAAAAPASTPQVVTINQSDRLDTVAASSTGDSSNYRDIAAANNVDNPKKVSPGTSLTIPS